MSLQLKLKRKRALRWGASAAFHEIQEWTITASPSLVILTMRPLRFCKIIDTDEHPRPDASLEKLAALRPVFKKDGVVTAANASGICDGAGTIILASEEAVKEQGLKPLARLASYHVSGCEPSIMGIGPVPAIKGALDSTGMTLADVDRVEINEAFAAQFLACAKDLQLDMSKTNLHGGAISLGHPLGASGSRITAHLANEFARADGNVFVGSACIGGGQGIAVVLERV